MLEIDGLIVKYVTEGLNDGFTDSFFAHIIREPDGTILGFVCHNVATRQKE